MKKQNKNQNNKIDNQEKNHYSFNFAWRCFQKFILFGSIIGLFISCDYYLPNISVSPSTTLNPQNVLLTPFIITNNTNMSIVDVKYSNSIRSLKTENGMTIDGGNEFKSRITDSSKLIPQIKAHEQDTMIFPTQFKTDPPSFVDMAIVVNFKLKFIPFKSWERLFRFVTAKDVEGKLHWYPLALSK